MLVRLHNRTQAQPSAHALRALAAEPKTTKRAKAVTTKGHTDNMRQTPGAAPSNELSGLRCALSRTAAAGVRVTATRAAWCDIEGAWSVQTPAFKARHARRKGPPRPMQRGARSLPARPAARTTCTDRRGRSCAHNTSRAAAQRSGCRATRADRGPAARGDGMGWDAARAASAGAARGMLCGAFQRGRQRCLTCPSTRSRGHTAGSTPAPHSRGPAASVRT